MSKFAKENNSDDDLESIDISDDDNDASSAPSAPRRAPVPSSTQAPKKSVNFVAVKKTKVPSTATTTTLAVPVPVPVPVPTPPVPARPTIKAPQVPEVPEVPAEEVKTAVAINVVDVMTNKLSNLRIFLIMSSISIAFSCFLTLYALLAVDNGGLSPTLLSLVILIVSGFSIAATKLWTYKPIFTRIFPLTDFYSIQKCSTQFHNTVVICLGMLFISLTSLCVTLFVIIFRLKTSLYCPDGVFNSYSAMTSNGQAIFILLFLNFAFALVSFTLAIRQSYGMCRFYLEQAFMLKKEATSIV
jgi:hypothetical protein